MARFKQPKKKFWRIIKYIWLQQCRRNFKQERAYKLGLLVCEVCGKMEEEVDICHHCFRCYRSECNAGCMSCRRISEIEYCKCCGHII